MNGDPHAGRAASYRESWELHRAAEMIHQVAECVDRAHEIEATIAYDIADYPSLAPVPRPSQSAGFRCDRLAGRSPPLGRPRLPRTGTPQGSQAPQGRRPGPGDRRPRSTAYRGQAQGRRTQR